MSYEKLAELQPRLIIGTKQTLRAMNNNAISEVFVATDANEKVTKQVVQLAEELDISCTFVGSKNKLGTACGIDVSTSTVGVKKE